jgi:hypothetical protein
MCKLNDLVEEEQDQKQEEQERNMKKNKSEEMKEEVQEQVQEEEGGYLSQPALQFLLPFFQELTGLSKPLLWRK